MSVLQLRPTCLPSTRTTPTRSPMAAAKTPDLGVFAAVVAATAADEWGAIDARGSEFRAIERALEADDLSSAAINPHADEVVGEVVAWARAHGLVEHAEAARALSRARIHVLAGHGHPTACRAGFLLTAQWCHWLFFQDDFLCDRLADRDDVLGPDALAEAHTRILAALRGQRDDSDDPLCTSARSIGRAIVQWRGSAALARFAQDVEEYLWGTRWEALNRVRGDVPSVSAFTKMRPHAGAAYTAFQFWEIVESFELTDAARNHVAARELRLMANNCISWANDLYSLGKELREGNANNLVIALAAERGEGWRDAMGAAVDLYNREYRAFCQLAADLPRLGVGAAPLDLGPYAARLHGWIRGNLLWSRSTLRYRESLSMRVLADGADARGVAAGS